MRIEVESYIARLRKKIAAAEAFLASLEEDEHAVEMVRPTRQPTLPTHPPVTLPTPNGTNGNAPATPEYGKNVKSIRHVLDVVPEVFTVDHVEKALETEKTPLNRDTISQALSKLARTGELKVETRGAGRRPSEYRLNPDHMSNF